MNLTLNNPSTGNVSVAVRGAGFSIASTADYTYATQTLNFTGTSNSLQTITIPIINDTESEQDEYFVLTLQNATGASITGQSSVTVYIRDNNRKAPTATKSVELKFTVSFDPSPTTGSTTEIVVYDSASRLLFMTSVIEKRIDIADFTNPSTISLVKSVDMTPWRHYKCSRKKWNCSGSKS